MRLPAARQSRKRTATASVELAVVLPVLVTLILGVWEFGRLIEAQQILCNAAREGARQASAGTKIASDIDTIVKNYMAAAGLNTANYTVTVYNLTVTPSPNSSTPNADPSAAIQMDHLQVNVTLPVNNVKWLVINKVFSSKSKLSASADWYSMKDKPLTVDSTMPSS